MKKILLISVLSAFLLIGCSMKDSKTVKDEYRINKTKVEMSTDQIIADEIIDGRIYTLSDNFDSNEIRLSAFSDGAVSNIDIGTMEQISDLFIGKTNIYTVKNNESNSEISVYDISGKELFNISLNSKSEIDEITEDSEGNISVIYIPESDYKIHFEKYDLSGILKSSFVLSDLISLGDYEEIISAAFDKNNNAYLISHNCETSDYTLLKYNSDFSVCISKKKINDTGETVNGIFINESGKLVLSGYDNAYCYVNIIDADDDTSNILLEFPGVHNVFNGGKDGLVYAKDKKVILYNMITGEESVIIETEDNITDMWYSNDKLIFCSLDCRIPLLFRITDKDNNTDYEEKIYIENDAQIKDVCFSKDNKLYMLLSDQDAYKIGVADGSYKEYKMDLDYYIDEAEHHAENYNLTIVGENLFFVSDNDVYSFNTESQSLLNITNRKYEKVKDICLSGERVFILYSENGNDNVAEYLRKENQLKKLISLETGISTDNDSILSGNEDYIYYLNRDNKLCGYTEDMKCDTVINWEKTYSQMYIDSFSLIEKDKYLCVSEDKDVYIIENNAEMKSIRLNIAYLGNQTAVYEQYIRELSDKFELNVKKYADYDQNGDRGIGQFNLDIASGNIPDVIITSGGFTDLDLYREKGLIENLDKYIENDSIIKEEEYLQSVFELNSYNGNLYYITPQINIKSIVSKESKNNPENLDYEEMYDLLVNKYSVYDNNIFGDEDSCVLLNYFLSVHKELQNAGKLNVDNNDFRAMLKIAKEYGHRDNAYYKLDKKADDFKSDKQIFLLYSFSGFDYYNYYEKCILDDKISFNGVSADKNDNIAVECGNSLCITSACPNKEEAWGFIRTFIMDDYQNYIADQVHFGFPVKYSALKRSLNNSQNPEFVPKNMYVGERKIPTTYISNETAENIIARIENCKLKCKIDARIMAIIDEEAMFYFEDEKNIDQTIEAINTKINLYINEIK